MLVRCLACDEDVEKGLFCSSCGEELRIYEEGEDIELDVFEDDDRDDDIASGGER